MHAASEPQSRQTTEPSAHVTHHPVFSKFQRWRGRVPPDFIVNFLGVMARVAYFEPYAAIDSTYPPDRYVETQYSDFDEEYFEWIDLLEAVSNAEGSFTMLELGAGHGRWTVNAAAALQQFTRLPYSLTAVEAEPTHFQWITQHIADNSMDPSKFRLIQAAVAPVDGSVGFHFTDPKYGGASQWYGQHIGGPELVEAISLTTLLKPLQTVDLIDLDIQGAEAKVLGAAAEQLNQKVKRVHIGTHGLDVETALNTLFNRLGWDCIYSFPSKSASDTDWGRIFFQDGVQSWLNPTFSNRAEGDAALLARKLAASRQEIARMHQEIEGLQRERETQRILDPSSFAWRILAKAGRLRDRIAPVGSKRRKWVAFIAHKI